jgi:beta-lactamase superfamily II metal-dependent hydrolase
VDLLKVPHHGSDRNVSTDFFRQITADHYIISADGKYGNPEIATLKMMSEARGKDAYKVYLTNKETRLEDFYKREKASRKKCEYIFGPKDAWSVKVDLDDPLKD